MSFRFQFTGIDFHGKIMTIDIFELSIGIATVSGPKIYISRKDINEMVRP